MKINNLQRDQFTIEVDNAKDLEDAIQCYGGKEWEDPTVKALAVLALRDQETVTVQASKPDQYFKIGGGFGRFTADVSTWFQPYFDALKERTGSGAFPLDLTPTARRITHTHITEQILCDGVSVMATQVLKVWGFSGDSEISPERFQKFGRQSLIEYIGNEFGKTNVPPEFEELENGLFRKRHGHRPITYTPNAYNGDVWQFLFGAWLEQFGTEGQKALIARFARVHNSKELFPSLRSSHREGLHLDNYHASATWEEFRNA